MHKPSQNLFWPLTLSLPLKTSLFEEIPVTLEVAEVIYWNLKDFLLTAIAWDCCVYRDPACTGQPKCDGCSLACTQPYGCVGYKHQHLRTFTDSTFLWLLCDLWKYPLRRILPNQLPVNHSLYFALWSLQKLKFPNLEKKSSIFIRRTNFFKKLCPRSALLLSFIWDLGSTVRVLLEARQWERLVLESWRRPVDGVRGGQNELAIGQFDEFVPDEKSENVGPFLISDGEVRDPKT